MRGIIVGFLFVFFLVACEKRGFYDEYKVFEDQAWHTDSIKEFTFFVEDTIKKYNIILRVRHTTEYDFQNLFLFVQLDKKDTLEVKLANKEGAWKGKGMGDVREVEYTYKNNFIFPQKNKVVFKIEQAMRYGDFSKIEKLNNILSVGVSIIEQDG